MSNIKKLAQYVVYSYEMRSNSQFNGSELKLQKLMYLAQRESLALTGKPLFDEPFEGWQYGPVLPQLRFYFEDDYEPFSPENDNQLTEQEQYIIDNVICQYGKYEPWALADLTHKEKSWLKSRAGLSDGQHGYSPITADDILEDAKDVRLFDHEYDMYLDEFDEFDDEVLSL